MKLFNTLSRKAEDFVPLDSETARIYSCGPTVYNHAHIGNLSSYIFADILRRAINLAGYETQHVMNFTDVDDKTVRDSKIKYPDLTPLDALTKLTGHYESIFLDEMMQVGDDADAITFVRATDYIADIQNLIKKLLEFGVAYTADDGIYFDISEYQKTRKYGQLSHIDAAAEARARIDNDEYDKESAQDFALWKKQKDGEPSWDLKIDGQDFRGRPGWHIECSAMSVKKLGQPFDIHTGGVDLIFPHHENEIAQSTAGDQPEQLANFFVHNEHLLVDGKKMSKSAHNFYTLPDIIEKGFGPLDFRMLVLQSHYRSAINFSWDNLEAAQNRRRNWRNIAELRWQINSGGVEFSSNLLETYLLNDLSTPMVLAGVDKLLDGMNGRVFSQESVEQFMDFVDENLGLQLRATTPDITDKQKELIKKRTAARAEKDFVKSDEIRDKLAEQGIELNDTADKTIWSRR